MADRNPPANDTGHPVIASFEATVIEMHGTPMWHYVFTSNVTAEELAAWLREMADHIEAGKADRYGVDASN